MNIHNLRKTHYSIQHLICVLTVVTTAVICYYSFPPSEYRAAAFVLFVVTTLLATVFEIYPVFVASALSALIWNYFFIPPTFTFHIDNGEDIMLFLMYFCVSFLNSVLTYKIRKEERKSRIKAQKEQELKFYNTLFNSLSHELRTPIATIMGGVDLMRDPDNKITEQNQQELLYQMSLASERLHVQVDNLLNMSRLESGVLSPKLDWCDINDLTYGMLEKYQFDKAYPIEVLTNDQLPIFRIDRGLVEHIMLNLIQNAIQHNAPGTKITVHFYEDGNEGLIGEIADNGQGIPEQYHKQIFNKFFRMPNAPTGGTGLGLSIVRWYCNVMGGTIQASSNTPSGVLFKFSIPCEISYLMALKNE